MLKRILLSRFFHFFLLFALLTGLLFVRIEDYSWLKQMRFMAFDTYNQLYPRQKTDQVVILDIDEASLKHPDLGQWPWSRHQMARIVDNLSAMGAKTIVFDITFPEKDRTSPATVFRKLPGSIDLAKLEETGALIDYDAVFANAIKQAGNVVTGFTRADSIQVDEDYMFDTVRNPRIAKPLLIGGQAKKELFDNVAKMRNTASNIEILTDNSAGNGFFSTTPDVDGKIRKIPLVMAVEHRLNNGRRELLHPSLALETVRVAQNPKQIIRVISSTGKWSDGPFDTRYKVQVGDFVIPMTLDGKIYTYFSRKREDDYIPAYTVFDKSVPEDRIRDKIVLIGTSAEGLRDIRSTPLDLFVAGVEGHVNVIEQILTETYLIRSENINGAELFFVAVIGFLIIILAPFLGAVMMAAFTLLLIGGFGYLSWYSFMEHKYLFDPVFPAFSFITLFMMSSVLSYIRSEGEKKHVRDTFSLYISPDYIKELTANPDAVKLGGESKELTVMFTDIRGFTSISEKFSPEALTKLMNDFLTPMSDLVMENRGTIDKYMGDAMMAFWNAPLDDPDHAFDACRTALLMNAALEPINRRLDEEMTAAGKEPVVLKAGIGINTGICSVGNMGSQQRFAYSAMGDAVNLASRLEGQTKSYGVNTLIGDETNRQVENSFATLEMDLVRVKGKQEPVHIFTLVGDETLASSGMFREWRRVHKQMLESYRSQNFDQAEKLIAHCLEASNGSLSEFYALYTQRLAGFKNNPPPPDWDGVFVATSK